MEETKVGNLDPRLQKGFKIPYSKVKEAVLKCELEKNSLECKRMFKEMGIEVYD
jgi:hypothetical protein